MRIQGLLQVNENVSAQCRSSHQEIVSLKEQLNTQYEFNNFALDQIAELTATIEELHSRDENKENIGQQLEEEIVALRRKNRQLSVVNEYENTHSEYESTIV